MISQEIRRKFLKYFKDKGHTVVPSSSVVPHDDPTLLFTNAGMNQFKDVFLGKSKRDYVRAASSQKCIRVGGKHNDLDNVGHTSRHLTLFEMLGNFSFGDYFKKEAIAFAWEVTLNIFQFPIEKIWVTIFEDDDESFELWKAHISEKRIVRMGEKDNFWAMGETGPCGPCSELYFDKGEKYGKAKSIKQDTSGERFMEFWNLVFMQFNRDSHGKMHPLPNQSIDTGAGLERVVSLIMGVDNVFHTDILRHIIAQIEKTFSRKYDPNDQIHAPAFHVIADHLRSISFAIADGAQPSNIERGYVIRKLLRRAVRYGRTLLGQEEPFLAQIFPALLETMGSDYPELVQSKDRIQEILTQEEESFIRTLKRGGNILSSIVEKALHSPHKQISGEDAFKLKDTYGFPLEEILLIAKDTGLSVNIDSYQLLEEAAKERSRSSRTQHFQEAEANIFADFVKKHGPSTFVGYTQPKIDTEVIGILVNGEFIDSLSPEHEGLILLKQTPFYAEKGGQTTDTGTIFSKTVEFEVTDCQNPFPGIIVHKGTVKKGSLHVGDKVTAEIDTMRRQNIASHHTATHLLHYALQKILGEHIRQAGSLVEPYRLRFDFNHHKALSVEEICSIEDLVNQKIRQNQSVNTYEIPYEAAQSRADVKQFFGEKYGNQVRVVDIDYSKELCGGTHVYHVGNLGYFRIIKESSIASGVRRIEAVCGKAAEEYVRQEENLLERGAALLKTQAPKIEEKITQLVDENTSLKQQIRTFKHQHIKQLAEQLAKKGEKIGEITFLGQEVTVDMEDLTILADEIMGKLSSGIIALAIKLPNRVQVLVKISPNLQSKGFSAVSIIKEISPLIDGGGGGRPDAAQAGGKNPAGTQHVFQTIKSYISKQ